MRTSQSANFPLSALGGGKGRGEVGEPQAPIGGTTHLTLPLRGPLPLLLKGGEGQKRRKASPGWRGSTARKQRHGDQVDRPKHRSREGDGDVGDFDSLVPGVQILDQVVGKIATGGERVEQERRQPG